VIRENDFVIWNEVGVYAIIIILKEKDNCVVDEIEIIGEKYKNTIVKYDKLDNSLMKRKNTIYIPADKYIYNLLGGNLIRIKTSEEVEINIYFQCYNYMRYVSGLYGLAYINN
jgi:hypothetical protein